MRVCEHMAVWMHECEHFSMHVCECDCIIVCECVGAQPQRERQCLTVKKSSGSAGGQPDRADQDEVSEGPRCYSQGQVPQPASGSATSLNIPPNFFLPKPQFPHLKT